MAAPAKNYLKELVEELKDPDKDIRYSAVMEIVELGEEEDLEMNLLSLEWLAEEAASAFPKTGYEWDDPSFHLVDFVTNFRFAELAEKLAEQYAGYSLSAREAVITYISTFKGLEERIYRLIEQDLTEGREFPMLALLDQPHLARRLVENSLHLLDNDAQKETLYELLSLSLDRGLMEVYRPEFVTPLLAGDYEKKRALYKGYEKDYALAYVYGSWKDTYLSIRGDMCILLSLMEYYFDEQMKAFAEEALQFKDRLIRMSAVIALLKKGFPADQAVLQECAENPETCEPFYLELIRIKKEDWFPIKENRQEAFARSHLFRHAVHLHGFVPEELSIQEKVEIQEEEITFRYYLAAVKEEGSLRPAWIGGYPLHEGDDLPFCREETHILEEDYRSAEKHVKEFLDGTRKMLEYEANKVHYVSKPRVSRWYYILYPVLAYRIFQAASSQDPVYIGLTSLLFILVTGTHLYQWKFRRQKVELTGTELRYTERGRHYAVKLNEIGEITIERAGIGSRLFDAFSKKVAVYDKKGTAVMKFPLNAVNYEDFVFVAETATEHLEEQPKIEMPE